MDQAARLLARGQLCKLVVELNAPVPSPDISVDVLAVAMMAAEREETGQLHS
jgi:hypothetical protein